MYLSTNFQLMLKQSVQMCTVYLLSEVYNPGPGCAKLTMSIVNVSLNFQKLISHICQYFLLRKCEKLLQCKSFSNVFKQKISVYLVIKS